MSSRAAQLDSASPVRSVWLLAASFGIVTGFVEGAGLLAFQKLGWVNWGRALNGGVSREIVGYAVVVDVLVCLAGGLGLIILKRLFSRLPLLRWSAFLFALLAFFVWLEFAERIPRRGAFIFAVGLAVTFARWFDKHQGATLRFCRNTLPWLATAALLVWIAFQGGVWERIEVARLPPAAAGSPNILVIVVDTLRADHLSSYGYARITSPHVDQVAREGVLFENAFATSSWTLPSHASMLTGRYPYEHGAEFDRYDGRYKTVAEAFRDRGYRTGAFSGNLFWFHPGRGFGQGFLHFDSVFFTVGHVFLRTTYGRHFGRYVLSRFELPIGGRKWADRVTQETLEWVERDPSRPFFAFLNYFDVHGPYRPPQPFRSKFSKVPEPGGVLHAFEGAGQPKLSPEQLQGELDAYDGAIAYTDHQIGNLLRGLEKRGLSRNTVVVIVSDHGEMFGEHGLFFHNNALYRDVLRVPLIVAWKGHIPAGVRVAHPVSIASLPATLTDLAGSTDEEFPQPSLAAFLKEGPAPKDWPFLLAEQAKQPLDNRRPPAYYGRITSLISPRWHYIVHEKFGEQLYDWHCDPEELADLAKTPEGESVAGDFAAILRGHSLRSEKAMARLGR